MQRTPCPGRPLGAVPAAFGDQLTADHIIARSERSQGVTGQEDALLVVDRATKWVDCFPLKDKSAENSRVALLSFAGDGHIGTVYTDGSRELDAAVRQLGVRSRYLHALSTSNEWGRGAGCEGRA